MDTNEENCNQKNNHPVEARIHPIQTVSHRTHESLLSETFSFSAKREVISWNVKNNIM